MYKIVSIVLIMLLAASTTMWLTTCSDKKELKKVIESKDIKIAELHTFYLAWLDSCEQAYVQVDSIVYQDRWLPGKVIKIPQAIDSTLVYNIVNGQIELPEGGETYIRDYSGSLELEGLTAYYKAKTIGELIGLEITSYKLDEIHHYNTAVITKPPPLVDSELTYIYRKGWYITGAVGNNMQSFTSWTSIEFGFGYMTKKGISFGLDYQYLSLPSNDTKVFGSLAKVRMNYFFGK